MMVLFTHFFSWLSYGSLFFLLIISCSKNPDIHQSHSLSLENERKIGYSIDRAVLDHFNTNPSKKVLSPDDHSSIYNYLQQCILSLHGSDYYTDFLEEHPLTNTTPTLRILQDSSKTGAFIAPGGHIYLYTDLLQTLQTKAQLMAVLSHLIVCSAYKYDLKKLEARFSRNFLFDVALGRDLTNSSTPRSGADLHAVMEELESKPYNTQDVNKADSDVEPILCELGYDLRSYSDLHQFNSTIDWLALFPRTTSTSAYSMHLNILHNNDPNCNGQIVMGNYSNFKLLLP